MRVLFCSSYFWPDRTGIALYADGLARHLADRGDEVTVVTGFPHYPSWKRAPGARRLRATERTGAVMVERRWHYVPARQSGGRRAAYEASFLTGLDAVARVPRPDVVIAMSPCLASAAVAVAAGRRHRAPVGLVFQDVVGLAARQSGIRGGARLAELSGRLERGLARRAARVGIITEGSRPYFAAGGVPAARMTSLRNWLERAEPDRPRDATRDALGWPRDAFVALHAGNMGSKQGLGVLLDAAARAAGTGVLVVLAGDGNERARLERHAAGLPAGAVAFLDVQRPGAYEAMLEAADVLVVSQRPEVREMALPSKLTAYFAAGRPVLAAVAEGSETAAELDRAGAGLVVPPADAGALAAAVGRLRDEPDLGAGLGARGRRYAAEHLERGAVLARWSAFVDATAATVP